MIVPSPPNQAIEEIKAILKKYDLAGMVVVQDANEAAYLREIAPTWSCAWIEVLPEGIAIRVRAKKEDYPSREAQKETVEATTGMFLSFLNWCTETKVNMEQMIAMLARHFPEITHCERHNR